MGTRQPTSAADDPRRQARGPMTGLLQGRACIVSGVGAGTGRALALTFAREGADLVLACRTERVAEDIAKEVETAGARALPVVADITHAEDRAKLVDAAV